MSSDTGAVAPACTKCRSHRVKCDRARPVCSRCARLGHHCEYPVRNPATAYVNYVEDLESQIAALEQQLQGPRDQESGFSPRAGEPGGIVTNQPDGPSMSSPAYSEHLISDLFAQTTNARDWDSKVKTLVDDLAQVSLSAMTAQGAFPSHDLVLRTLILSAALPVGQTYGDQPSKSLLLPHIDIAEKVCTRYCKDVLPESPFLTMSDVQQHMRRAYHNHDHYSIFIVATVLATTAIFLSPGSAESAVGLYMTGVQFLEGAFASSQQRDPLKELEAVVTLGQFALLAGDKYADSWALSGLAVRIAVDLGLHKICDTERKRRLFWTAYALDRKCAIPNQRPVGIPDGAIDTPTLPAPNVFELYRIMSAAYTLENSSSRTEYEALLRRLDIWSQQYQNQRPPSRLLERDITRIRKIIESGWSR